MTVTIDKYIKYAAMEAVARINRICIEEKILPHHLEEIISEAKKNGSYNQRLIALSKKKR